MARVPKRADESVYTIRKWLGINQSPEGETRIKYGEASDMRNFKITAGGALVKRGGSKNVAGLMNAYTAVDGTVENTIVSEIGNSTTSFTAYPRATTDSVGVPIGDGTPVQITAANASEYIGYYINTANGLKKLSGIEHTASQKIRNSWDRKYGGRSAEAFSTGTFFVVFNNKPTFSNGEWDITGAKVVEAINNVSGSERWAGYKYIVPVQSSDGWELPQKFSNTIPTIQEILAGKEFDTSGNYIYAEVSYWEAGLGPPPYWNVTITCEGYSNDKYEWKAYDVYSVPTEATTEVRGLWSGFVNGAEVICAACNGFLWQLELYDGTWSKTSCGSLNTDNDVFMFGFDDKLYILNGIKYYVWDGTTLSEVEGYRPLVSIATEPSGGGELLEEINKLNGKRHIWYSADGTATVYQLPEKNISSVDFVKVNGTAVTSGWTANTTNGTVTFTTAPTAGTNNVDIGWSVAETGRIAAETMRFAEFYNGAQDTRVFLYGNGTNKAFYSGLDYDGNPRADYFPDMNECAVGESNTPITSMIRHYNRLLAFKLNSTYSIGYDTLTLDDGTTKPGFYISPVNRSIGNEAPGQAVLVENRPRTLDGRSVIGWKATSSSGNITGDQRNAEVLSDRVRATMYDFDIAGAKTFYDKINHEFYVIGSNGVAVVNNTTADAWYVYTGFAATCLITYKDELYYGTADGYLRHFSNEYFSDEGVAIDAYWESGALDFGTDYKRKYSGNIWVGIKPEENGYLEVSAETDRKSDFDDYTVSTEETAGTPTMTRLKIKAKKLTYYKLILKNNTADKTATVVSADIRIRPTGYVR